MLDTDEKYAEQLKHYMHRFTLRAQLYVEPKTDLDKATKIMEHVRIIVEIVKIMCFS